MTHSVFAGTELISSKTLEYSWHELRIARDAELVATDHWAMKDRVMSQEKKDYRTFLRDMPANFDEAGALAAWHEFDIPE